MDAPTMFYHLPAPALHVVMLCLSPLDVLLLSRLSKSAAQAFDEPSLFYKMISPHLHCDSRASAVTTLRAHNHTVQKIRAMTSASIPLPLFLDHLQFSKTSLLARCEPPRTPYARVLRALAASTAAEPAGSTDAAGDLTHDLRVRLRHTSFGSLSDNARGFRGRDTPEYLSINARTGEGWNELRRIARMHRPITSEEPTIIIDHLKALDPR
ncbi:hypothetical protein TeGR_g11111 [Tetraparma gracilis]|uniref:F-box domain-containing protein n=1 Tax=Tetraparma gracilis TaxID=2962635 RepID=A0ABQ6N3G4_9STRA|nr:hypothetical protein TeGR_g11111 [Tetraparma gracilis]